MLRQLIVAAIAIAPAWNAYAQSEPQPQPAYVMPKWSEQRPAPPNYDQAPPALRDFLLKAKKADEIADPLQRCLAFPDLPDTKWPKDLVEEHCQYVYGLTLRFEDVKARIDAGDVVGLEKIFRGLLDRHFSKTDFSENIHRAFWLIQDDSESDRVTARWLKLAPDSAYAMTARAQYLSAKGWSARGTEWASETSEEKMAQMYTLHEQAAALYHQALEKEPRMMPAYAGLVVVGRGGADAGDAFEQGRKVDPGCEELMAEQMITLQPRWSGSWPEMQALARSMQPYLAERPLLALSRSYPFHDMADTWMRAEQPDPALAVVKLAIVDSSNPFLLEDAAFSMAALNSQDRWTILAYLVASTRFHSTPTCACGGMLASSADLRAMLQATLAHDLQAANRSYAFQVKILPDDANARLRYAESFESLYMAPEAEREYLVAERLRPDKWQAASVLNQHINLLMRSEQFDKALIQGQRMVKDYPDFALGWLTYARTLANAHAPADKQREALETYLRKVNRNDPTNASEIAMAEMGLRELSKPASPH